MNPAEPADIHAERKDVSFDKTIQQSKSFLYKPQWSSRCHGKYGPRSECSHSARQLRKKK